MKKCCTCRKTKSSNQFNRKSRNKDGLERYCKDCHRKLNRIHYKANKTAYKISALKFKRLLRAWYHDLKKALACKACNDTKYWRLTFHHRNPSTKSSEVSQMVNDNVSRKRILKEIDKCDVLCQNCHADVHYANRSVAQLVE